MLWVFLFCFVISVLGQEEKPKVVCEFEQGKTVKPKNVTLKQTDTHIVININYQQFCNIIQCSNQKGLFLNKANFTSNGGGCHMSSEVKASIAEGLLNCTLYSNVNTTGSTATVGYDTFIVSHCQTHIRIDGKGFDKMLIVWIGVGFLVTLIFIAQTMVILHFKAKAKASSIRHQSLNSRSNNEIDGVVRYSSTPGQKKRKKERIQSDLYETLADINEPVRGEPKIPDEKNPNALKLRDLPPPLEAIPRIVEPSTLEKKKGMFDSLKPKKFVTIEKKPEPSPLAQRREMDLRSIPEPVERPPMPLPGQEQIYEDIHPIMSAVPAASNTKLPAKPTTLKKEVPKKPVPKKLVPEFNGQDQTPTLRKQKPGLAPNVPNPVVNELDMLLKKRNANAGIQTAPRPAPKTAAAISPPPVKAQPPLKPTPATLPKKIPPPLQPKSPILDRGLPPPKHQTPILNRALPPPPSSVHAGPPAMMPARPPGPSTWRPTPAPNPGFQPPVPAPITIPVQRAHEDSSDEEWVYEPIYQVT